MEPLSQRLPRDQNRVPVMGAVDSSTGTIAYPLELNTSDGGLLVHLVNGGSGGTSSTFGQAFPTTGTAVGATNGTDMEPLNLDGSGNLLVNVAAGGAAGTQYQELATTSPATGNLVLGRYSTTLPTLTNAQLNEPMLDSSSRLLVNVINTSFTVSQGTAANLNATVVGTGTFVTQSETQDGAGNAITSASTTTTSKRGLDVNVLSILGTAPTTAGYLDIKGADGNVFVRQATAANLNATVTQASGEWNDNIAQVVGATASTAASGTLLVGNADGAGNKLTSNSTTTTSKTGLDYNLISVLGTAPTTAGFINAIGTTTATTASGYPVNVGAMARTTEQSAATNTYNVNLAADKVGKLINIPFANPENITSGVASTTATTTFSVLASAGTGNRNYITGIYIKNTGSTASSVNITNGSAGTVLYTGIAPAGGGDNVSLTTPIAQTSTSTAIYAVAATASSAIYVTLTGYTGV